MRKNGNIETLQIIYDSSVGTPKLAKDSIAYDIHKRVFMKFDVNGNAHLLPYGRMLIDGRLIANFVDVASNIWAGGEIRAGNSLGTGLNTNGNSAIQFNVTETGVGDGVLFYDNADGQFKVDLTSAYEGYTLWHSGNFTPPLVDTDSILEGAAILWTKDETNLPEGWKIDENLDRVNGFPFIVKE